ncbi:MAG: hypothetical protein EOP56_13555 [Sphingobacteriales bacterium]|nr:MAG: hypothetical protein EOP56_13555 [Sphingobacteriales bacterium]
MRTVCFVLLLFCSHLVAAQSGEEIISKMYSKYHGKWHKTLTFVQKTEFYKNDSLKGTQTWYEAIKYPNLFRIDLGSPDSGNTSLWRDGIAYRYKKHQMISSRGDANELIFLLGGMYSYSLDSVKNMMKSFKFDLSKSYDSVWQGNKIYVVGSDSVGQEADQFWVDKKRLVVVRLLQFTEGRKSDARFSGHVKKGNSWVESKVDFYINDKLVQKEFYQSISTDVSLPDEFFHPALLFDKHWYKKD